LARLDVRKHRAAAPAVLGQPGTTNASSAGSTTTAAAAKVAVIRWERKPGPLSQRWGGLARHALTGAAAWAVGRFVIGHWVGSEWGAGLSVLVVAAGGYVWEHHTPETSRKFTWPHPFGDALDYAAFGALLAPLEILTRILW
jgi:hypothetical protein